MLNIKYISTIEEYHKEIKYLSINEKELAVDIETYVLPQYKGIVKEAFNPHDSGISTIQLKGNGIDKPVYVFDILLLDKEGYDKNLLKDLLESRTVLLGHNISFEAKFFKKYFGCHFRNMWCTRVAAQLIANAFSSKFIRSASANSLDMLCRDYLNIELTGKGSTQIEDWYIRPLSQEKLRYAATDVLYLFDLKNIFEEVLYKESPDPLMNIPNDDDWGLDMKEITEMEMKFINVEAECEFNGLPINTYTNNLFENSLGTKDGNSGQLQKVAGELCQLVNLSVQPSMDPTIDYLVPTKDAIKTLNSSQKLVPIINKYIGHTSTAEGQVVRRILTLLEQIVEQGKPEFYSEEEEADYTEFKQLLESDAVNRHQVASLLVKYKMLAKQASMKLSRFCHFLTNRIHYTLNSLGASTGRCSSSNPNSQNINAKVEVDVLIESSQIELLFKGQSIPASYL